MADDTDDQAATGEFGSDDIHLSMKAAILEGDTKTLQRIIFAGCDVNFCLTPDGATPAILSVLSNSIPCLQLVQRRGADLLLASNNGKTAFHYACEIGNLDFVNFLVENGGHCDVGDSDGDTPLMLASFHGHEAVVAHLLQEHYSDINAVNHDRQTALHKAVLKDSVECVRILISHDATVDRRNESVGETALMYACRHGNLSIVKILLDAGADAIKLNKQGESSLFLSAKEGHASIVRALLNHKTLVPIVQTPGGTTGPSPFCAAATNGHANIVRLLINAGMAYEAKSAFQTAAQSGHSDVISAMIGHLPGLIVQEPNDILFFRDLMQQSLLLAVGGCHLNVMKVLLDTKHCEVNYQYPPGGTALHEAVRRGDIRCIELLLANGADNNIKDRIGITPFTVSVVLDRVDIVKYFLEMSEFGASPHGIDITTTDNYGNTPLHLATARGHTEILSILLQYGFDINARNSYGQACIHLAAYLGNSDIMQCLLEADADINITDRELNTPLILAARRNHIYVAIQLLNESCDPTLQANHEGQLYDALQWAAKNGYVSMCRLLVEAGMNPINIYKIFPKNGQDLSTSPAPSSSNNTTSNATETNILKCEPAAEILDLGRIPLSLQNMCRIVIRSQMAEDKKPQAESLPLPVSIRDSLLLHEYIYNI